MARIMRGQVQSLRQQEFVEAAISIGLSPATIIRRHMIPNALGPVIVYTTLTIPGINGRRETTSPIDPPHLFREYTSRDKPINRQRIGQDRA